MSVKRLRIKWRTYNIITPEQEKENKLHLFETCPNSNCNHPLFMHSFLTTCHGDSFKCKCKETPAMIRKAHGY